MEEYRNRVINLLADLFKIISKLLANYWQICYKTTPPHIRGVPSGPPWGDKHHRVGEPPVLSGHLWTTLKDRTTGGLAQGPPLGGWPRDPLSAGERCTLERLAGGLSPHSPYWVGGSPQMAPILGVLCRNLPRKMGVLLVILVPMFYRVFGLSWEKF